MMLRLDSVRVARGGFSLAADGTFLPGIHRVSGAVGSGKSTLALAMAGLLKPVSGTVRNGGIRSSLLSLQFPEYHVTGATVSEECASWGLDPALVLDTEGFRGQEDRDPATLSRGELKRLHLACVLARPCDLLLLDEPFSALDCRQKQILCRRLGEKRPALVVIFSHEEEFLPAIDHSWEITGGILHDRGTRGTDDGIPDRDKGAGYCGITTGDCDE